MINQSEIDTYITVLKRVGKKKLISIIINLTANISNLQIEYEKLNKEGKHDLNIDSNNKAGKRIITTD